MSTLPELINELKRRRVFRVAGAYLVGAWIVLQVADTLMPALRLPVWTVTLVAILAVLGFPIALMLGWAFDLTPGGIERTPSTAKLRFPSRAAVAGSLIVALGVTGFVGARRRVRAARLDMNAVVVMPFRVLGDANLGVMREGMVDLLSAKLDGEGGARAIDSRTTLAAWRRKVDSDKEDLPPLQAMQLARGLGAGQVLLGQMVGTGGQVELNATLYSAVTGAKIESVDDTASADAVLKLVDRVVAKLLTQQAGQAHQIDALLSESLVAVKAYLEGQRLYRRGSYEQAAQQYRTALNQDSTFALAGFGLAQARSWTGRGLEYNRGAELSWKYRDRLPQRDREFITAWLGPNYPKPRTFDERIKAWERLLVTSSDRVEAWYEYGDELYHLGSAVGIDSSYARALDAWSRALALDSLFAPALEHQISVYAERGDTTQLRRIANLLYQRVRPDTRLTGDGAWVAALALDDEPWLAELRKHMSEMPSDAARFAGTEIVRSGLPQSDVALLHSFSVKKAAGALGSDQRIDNVQMFVFSQLNIGHPKAAFELLQGLKEEVGANQFGLLALVLAMVQPTADSVATRAAYEAIDASIREAGGPSQPKPDADKLRGRCVVEGWRVLHGNSSTTQEAIAQMRAFKPGDETDLIQCAAHLDALVKLQTGSPDARNAVERVDSLLRHTAAAPGLHEHMVLYTARAFQQLGDLESAYRTIKLVWRDVPIAYSTLVLERARLAAATKRRDEAVHNYQLFLKMQPNPEPGAPAELVARVRTELAALVGERTH